MNIGDDVVVEFVFKTVTGYDANGDPVTTDTDLSAYPRIAIFIYQTPKEILAQFSRVSDADYDDLTVTDEQGGLAEITIPRDVTLLMRTIELKCDIIVIKSNGKQTSARGVALDSVCRPITVVDIP